MFSPIKRPRKHAPTTLKADIEEPTPHFMEQPPDPEHKHVPEKFSGEKNSSTQKNNAKRKVDGPADKNQENQSPEKCREDEILEN